MKGPIEGRMTGNIERAGGAEPLKWHWAVATAFAILFAVFAVWAVWLNHAEPKGGDFLSFWAAGRLTLQGTPALAYDLAANEQVRLDILARDAPLPFGYPPPFLLAIAAFAFKPFWAAFATWVLVGSALYLAASRRFAAFPYSAAQPTVFVNAVSGQNGFLSSAAFLGGMSMLASRPFLAGVVLGFLSLKPQLALLLPVALIAGREWRAIAGGIVAFVALTLLAVLALGWGTYAAFFAVAPYFTQTFAAGGWPYNELASPFASLRHLGVAAGPALAVHLAVALAATSLTAHAWYKRLPTRVPILAAATLLIPPYLFTYDTLLMVAPIGWLLANGRTWLAALVWLLCLLPVIAYWGFYPGPNTAPAAAILSLVVLSRPRV